MHKLFPVFLLFLMSNGLLFSQVSINTDNSQPDPSAMLDIKSTTKGVLFPRLTQSQIEAIPDPANGLLVFCTTDSKFYVFNQSINLWKEVAFGSGTISPPPPQVYFKVMDIMQDTLLTGCTLHIGSNSYVLSSGDTSMVIPTGTFEVSATHPDALDDKPRGPPGQFYPEYDAIQRPGQNAIVEQRAYNDSTSPVTFTGNADTLYIYKIMEDFLMGLVLDIVGSGPQGQTHRFSDNDLNAPAWFDLNYTAPTATTRERVLHWIEDQLPPATKGRLNMVYEEDTTQPTTPYLQMAIDVSFNPSNNTAVNANNEITLCYAHWPNTYQSTYVLGIEICQAIGDMNDISGIDPPILSYNTQTLQWEINWLGQCVFHLLYNFDPGTKF